MASYEKGKYSYSYNGKENTIYYNQAETDAAFKQISVICGDVLDYSSDTKTADKCFDGFPSKYSDLFPNPRYSAIASGIEANLNGIQRTVTTKMNQIIGAITDYCNGGDFAPESQKRIEDLLNSAANKKKPGGGPTGGDGGGGGGAPETTLDQEMVADQEALEGIPGIVIPLEDMTTTNDEEIVLGQIDGQTGGNSNSEVFVPFSGSDETLQAGAEGVDGENSDLSSSLLGSSSFVVPSSLEGTGKIKGIKGAGVLGAAGVAVAASAAIGAKIFYDSKHDDDEQDEDYLEMNEESGSDINNGFSSGLASIEFKKDLLNESEEDV